MRAERGRAMTTLWHLYLIECIDGSLYAGITTDVARRYAQHCLGKGAKYTRARPPVRLIGSRPCGDRSAALKAEHAIRQLSRPAKVAYFAATDSNEEQVTAVHEGGETVTTGNPQQPAAGE